MNLTIKNIYKSFGKNDVLKKISLDFKPGEVHGIVGENGAGKTTLFRCIAGLETPKGTIQYNQKIKNVLGYLETNPYFLSFMTGLEYLRFMCQARGLSLDETKQFNLFNLPLDDYAKTYSTGMQKKLALTATLLQKNEIYILDEPFNGVDLQSNIIINDIIKALKERGKIVLIASHIFVTLKDNCDYLHHLKDGQIINRCR